MDVWGVDASPRSPWMARCSSDTPPPQLDPSQHHRPPSPSPHPLSALVAVHPANTLPAAAIPPTPHSVLSRAVAAGAAGWLSAAQLTAWLSQVRPASV
jgi:hypothetical protein